MATWARPALVYDGSCGFCTRSALWIAGKWRVEADAVPAQRVDDATLGAFGLTRADTERYVWWVDTDGPRRGHRAIARALVATGGSWALVGRALQVPPVSWLARPGYWIVARLRHRLPGGTAACRL